MIDLSKYEGHTPGEWSAQDHEDELLIFAPRHGRLGERLATLQVSDLPSSRFQKDSQGANARLIADAPLLLAEVRRLDLEHKAAERELLWVRQSHARLLAAAKRTLTKRQSGAHYNECLAGQRGYGQCSTVCEVLKAAVAEAEALNGE